MSTAIDEGVLAAAARGDADAFAVIWRELSPAVAGYLASRGVADVEAVTSDVFVDVLPRLRRLAGGVTGLRTFVFSVAHARAVDEIRRAVRRPAQVPYDAQAHDRPSGETIEAAAPIQELVKRLAPSHREVLALRVVADLSLEQTATVMCRSVGSVKQLQRRALIALRELAIEHGVLSGAAPSASDPT